MLSNFFRSVNQSFARVFPFPLQVKGSRMYYNSMDRFLATCLWKTGMLEGFEMELFGQYVKPGMTVLDVGANMGVYSLYAARLVGPAGKVISFEPDPGNYATLVKNISANGYSQVQAHCLAVSDANETLFFESAAFNSGNHQVRKTGMEDMVTVNAVKLDDFLGNLPVDLIKIDIQGAEYFAMKGMEKMLQHNQDLIIFTEYWKKGLENNKVDPRAYLNFIHDLGFQFYLIDNQQRKLVKTPFSAIRDDSRFDSNYFNFVLSRKDL